MKGGFHRSRNRARVGDVDPGVGAGVHARDHQVGQLDAGPSGIQTAQPQTRAVGRASGDRQVGAVPGNLFFADQQRT